MCFKSKSKSQVYIQDLRKVMLFHGKRLKYPKNYNEIVNHGKVITNGTDSEGNTVLKLLFGKSDKDGKRPAWTLECVVKDECHSKAYYTMKLLSSTENLHKSCFEPLGFSRIDLETYLPVIDIKETGDPSNPYQLSNTLYLAKKGCSIDEELGEVDASSRKEKGLNGKQLYNSDYGKQDPSFFVIRDERDKIVVDITILCFPICLFVYTVMFFWKLLTFLPMKLGECLLCQQNLFAKVLGHFFFTPFVPLKFVVNLSGIFIKSPILLFVANEKKYADKYFVLWKHELMECFHELKSDCSVIKNGNRPVISDYDEYCLIGTWDELNIRRDQIKRSLDLP